MAKAGPKYTAQVVWVTSPEQAGELRYWADKEGVRLSTFLRRVARDGLTRTRRKLHAEHGTPIWGDVRHFVEISTRPGKRHAQLGWMDEPAFVGRLRYWAARENISLSDLLAKVMVQGWSSVQARLVRKHGEPDPVELGAWIVTAVSNNKWARYRRGEIEDPFTARAAPVVNAS